MTPTGSSGTQHRRHRADIRFSPWNLLLLVPLLMLFTPFFNVDSPRLGGMPFFYWFQLLFVPIGVICVAVVYVKTKHLDGRRSGSAGDRRSAR